MNEETELGELLLQLRQLSASQQSKVLILWRADLIRVKESEAYLVDEIEIAELNYLGIFSVKTLNALSRDGIKTLGALKNHYKRRPKDGYDFIRNLGKVGWSECKTLLQKYYPELF
jgi:hypothetical protein